MRARVPQEGAHKGHRNTPQDRCLLSGRALFLANKGQCQQSVYHPVRNGHTQHARRRQSVAYVVTNVPTSRVCEKHSQIGNEAFVQGSADRRVAQQVV